MLIGLDVDGVLGDFVGHAVATMKALGYPMMEPRDYNGWAMQSMMPAPHADAMMKLWREPGWCRSMPVLPGAVDFVQSLTEHGEVVFVTAPMPDAPHWCHERVQWLADHFGAVYIDVIFAHRKDLVSCAVLIDDKIEHVNAWARRNYGRRALLLETPHNVLDRQGKTLHPHARSVESYGGILSAFKVKR